MMKCKFNKYIDSYMNKIQCGEIASSKELKQAIDYIEEKLSNPDVVIKHEMIDKAIELTERYFEMKLLVKCTLRQGHYKKRLC